MAGGKALLAFSVIGGRAMGSPRIAGSHPIVKAGDSDEHSNE
jgi:hypothetical protein